MDDKIQKETLNLVKYGSIYFNGTDLISLLMDKIISAQNIYHI